MMEAAQRERDKVTQQLKAIKIKQEELEQRETQLASVRNDTCNALFKSCFVCLCSGKTCFCF